MIIDQQAILSVVQRMAWRFTQDYADDLAQITMIRAWLSWTPDMATQEDGELCAWLKTIMRYAWLDTQRKLSCRRSTQLDDSYFVTGNTEDDVERHELVEETLCRLNEKERVMLLLLAQDMPYKKIAERLHRHPVTVRQDMRRAKASFRREWAQVAA